MHTYPIIYVTVAYGLGILIERFAAYQEYDLLLLLLCFFLILGFVFIRKIITFSLQQFIFLLFIITFSSFYASFSSKDHVQYPLHSPKIKNAIVVGLIEEIDLIKLNKLALVIDVQNINGEKCKTKFDVNFICNFWDDTSNITSIIYDELKVGNRIEFCGTIARAKNQRNPGEFDYEKYLLNNGIVGVINCYKPETLKILSDETAILPNLIHSIRKSIDVRIKRFHSASASALLKGILLADRSDIGYEIKTSFINSGVIHVLAVSGLHVGFISLILFLVLGRFDIRIKYVFTIIGIILFLIITGTHPSVFRASIMAIVYLISKLTCRSTNGFNSVSIAALILLVLNPNELYNPGFQLSFSAVLSILIIYPLIVSKVEKICANQIVKKLLLFIAVSLSAQLGTLPFTLLYFNKLSLISLFANLLVIPIIGIVIAIGILTILFSLFSNFISLTFASMNILLIDSLYYFINIISELSFSHIPIYNFSIFDGLIFYTLLSIIIFLIIIYRNKLLLIISLVLIFFSLQNFILLDDNKLLPDGDLSILTIDVGQGDSFLIKFPNNETALIDAGNSTEYFDNGQRVILPLLQRLGIERINYAFVSHLDSDHFAGYISLLQTNIVDKLYKPKETNSVKDSIFEDYLTNLCVPFKYFMQQQINIGGCNVIILNDISNSRYKNFDSNNKSGIIKIVYGNNSFLFVGDAEIEAEDLITLKYGKFLNSDVLKVGHHGSSTSSSNEFLDLVNPKIAIISAGIMNKFGHPADETITKLKMRNIKIFRTDIEGAVLLRSDGESIKHINWRY